MRFLSLVVLFTWFGVGLFYTPDNNPKSFNKPPNLAKEANNAKIESGTILVALVDGVDENDLDLPDEVSLIERIDDLDPLVVLKLQVPAGEEQVICNQLAREAEVLYAEPNYLVDVGYTPDDPRWPEDPANPMIGSEQYGPIRVNAPQAWETARGSQDVTIAIIDTGVDIYHVEFDGRLVSGYDFIEDDNTPQDEHGHGTHVAGIAAATGNNGMGIAGIDWKAKIMPVRVLGATGSGTVKDTAAGIMWAVKHGADVINLSLGSTIYSALLEDATYYAYTHNVVVVAAAGNDFASSLRYPARFPWVIAVTATNETDNRYILANWGAQLDVAAPGYSILSTMPGDIYDLKTGTSMAVPHVTGTVSLMLSLSKFKTPDQVDYCLKQTAKDLGDAGFDIYFGYGLIQTDRALACDPPETETGTKPDNPDAPETKTIVRLITSEGGVISLYPFRLVIPPGWISEPVNVTLVYTSGGSTLEKNGLVGTGAFLEIQVDNPSSLSFQTMQPVLVYAYQADDLVLAGGYAGNLVIASLDESSGLWKWQPTTAGAGQLVAPLSHFSSYGVFAVQPEALPVTGGDAVSILKVWAGLFLVLGLRIVSQIFKRY